MIQGFFFRLIFAGILLAALPAGAQVAHDAATESAGYTTADPFTFDHTPAGTPRAVVVFIIQLNATDRVTAVTYGGTAMTRVTLAQDTLNEAGAVYAYFLGASVPTGTQTISIDHDGFGVDKEAIAITLTAAADTEVADSDVVQENAANPQVTLTSARDALRYAAISHGLPVVTDLTEVANSTRLFDTDQGARVDVSSRENAVSTSFTIGWTAVTDDVAMAAVAIQEVAPGGGGAFVKLAGPPQRLAGSGGGLAERWQQ